MGINVYELVVISRYDNYFTNSVQGLFTLSSVNVHRHTQYGKGKNWMN